MLREIILSNSQTFIGSWFIRDLSICDDLINYFEASPDKYQGMIGRYDYQDVIDNQSKKSTDLSLNDDNSSLVRCYQSLLQEVVDCYRKKYIFCDLTEKWSLSDIGIQRYYPGEGFYQWHCERNTGFSPAVLRHLTFMTYLNDVNDQGETEFFYQELKVKPEKGLTLIWPTDWTHTHRGITSPSQTKYIITGWYSFVIS